MNDLARLARCSINTVSLALRDSHRISEKTRAKIQKLARDHSYRPNPLVSALVSSRRKSMPPQTIAFLTKFERPFRQIPNMPLFCKQLLAGMSDKAASLGFRLEEFPTALPDSPDAARLTRILLARGIRGVMLFPSGDITTSFPALEWEHFAVVAAGFHSRHWPVHRTAMDQGRGMEQCLEHLQARGYRRIGFALSKLLDPRWGYSASGRYFAWQALQPRANRLPVISSELDLPTNEELAEWALKHRPDAVIVHNDPYVDVLRGLKASHGLDVVPVVINSSARDDVPGVVPRTEELGRASISVLARELYLNHYGIPAVPEVTLVGGKWREGAGLLPLPAGVSPGADGLLLNVGGAAREGTDLGSAETAKNGSRAGARPPVKAKGGAKSGPS